MCACVRAYVCVRTCACAHARASGFPAKLAFRPKLLFGCQATGLSSQSPVQNAPPHAQCPCAMDLQAWGPLQAGSALGSRDALGLPGTEEFQRSCSVVAKSMGPSGAAGWDGTGQGLAG